MTVAGTTCPGQKFHWPLQVLCLKMEKLLCCRHCCKKRQRQDWKKHKLVCQGREDPRAQLGVHCPLRNPALWGPELCKPAKLYGEGRVLLPGEYMVQGLAEERTVWAHHSPAPRIFCLAGL